MYLAEKTVKNYVSNLLSKLGMSRRTEAAALAARLEERSLHDDSARRWLRSGNLFPVERIAVPSDDQRPATTLLDRP